MQLADSHSLSSRRFLRVCSRRLQGKIAQVIMSDKLLCFCEPQCEEYVEVLVTNFSGKKKEPKPKLLSPDILRWGGGPPREGVGAEKFGLSLKTRETKLFWRDTPGFCRDIAKVPEKFEGKKGLCSIIVPQF